MTTTETKSERLNEAILRSFRLFVRYNGLNLLDGII